MIYAIGHVSGAHFNPAVTLAFAITRHFPASRVFGYWAAQFAGAVAAAAVLRAASGTSRTSVGTCRPAPTDSRSSGRSC